MQFTAPSGAFHIRERSVVSEKEVMSYSQDNHAEDQPAVGLHMLTAVETEHLRDVLFNGDARTRGSDARS